MIKFLYFGSKTARDLRTKKKAADKNQCLLHFSIEIF
jgi:hypothetical protein